MREASRELGANLLGSFDYRWYADLAYNGAVRIADLPISEPRFTEDGSAKIQQAGSCTVVWSDELARSLVPRYVNDPLAPFGAQLWVSCVVSAGMFQERVPFARFEITDVPEARDADMNFRGQWLTFGSSVELELKEITAAIDAETFDSPSSAVSLASAWAEIARIAGLPVVRTVPDAQITRTVMYEGKALDVIYELADVVLDAVPHITPTGAMAARPNAWPAPVARLTRADHLVKVGQSMSAANVFNRVVVRATGGSQQVVLAVAELRSGPLRVSEPDGWRSPFGRRTKYLSSEYVTTEQQAQEWADSTLKQVSTPRAQVLPVTEIFDPRRERGDVVLIERPEAWVLGRVVSIARDTGPTQQLNVEVGATTPK